MYSELFGISGWYAVKKQVLFTLAFAIANATALAALPMTQRQLEEPLIFIHHLSFGIYLSVAPLGFFDFSNSGTTAKTIKTHFDK